MVIMFLLAPNMSLLAAGNRRRKYLGQLGFQNSSLAIIAVYK
jgi:hypothetical protein